MRALGGFRTARIDVRQRRWKWMNHWSILDALTFVDARNVSIRLQCVSIAHNKHQQEQFDALAEANRVDEWAAVSSCKPISRPIGGDSSCCRTADCSPVDERLLGDWCTAVSGGPFACLLVTRHRGDCLRALNGGRQPFVPFQGKQWAAAAGQLSSFHRGIN